jgi:three-Cys-motif partner protein
MADANDILWECAPRTRAKLRVLNEYLGAWFNILGTRFSHLVYVDGFCGPGKYRGGEDGSPIIAIRHANLVANKFDNLRIKIVCVDREAVVIEHLRKTVGALSIHNPKVAIHYEKSCFADLVPDLFRKFEIKDWPMFSFVDPFGFGDSPFEKIKPLMKNHSSEIFVNFMCGFVNRFKQHQDPDIRRKIIDLVGTENLDRVIRSDDGITTICEIYRENLGSIGKFVKQFQMRDESGVRDNALFFCGNNRKGFEKIKEAMWKIDPTHGREFSAYDAIEDSGAQASLGVKEPQTRPLRSLLSRKFAGRKDISVSEINDWVIEENEDFLPKHVKIELENLHQQGQLTYVDPSPTGRHRRPGDWPDRLRLTFKHGD